MSEDNLLTNRNMKGDNLRRMLFDLMKNGVLTDVTLVCDDQKSIEAHKIILTASSPMFAKIINNFYNSNNAVIFLKGIKYEEMESILKYIYLGQVSVPKDTMDGFFDLAKYLEISEMNSNMNMKNPKSEYLEESDDKRLLEMDEGDEESENEGDYSQGSNVMFPTSQCPVCHKLFTQKGSMQRHVYYKHQGEKYSCPKCDYRATTRGALKIHNDALHEGIKLTCSYCDKKFTQKSNLGIHIQSVHEGKKFECNICHKIFSNKHGMKAHVKAIHEKGMQEKIL